MDWLQSKGAQIVGLVSIIGTLAGFGYTGATYVNRIENLEAKVSALSTGENETDDGLDAIEQRFASLETSVEFINKSIDDTILLDVKENTEEVTEVKIDLQKVESTLEALEKIVEKLEDSDKNPLAN